MSQQMWPKGETDWLASAMHQLQKRFGCKKTPAVLSSQCSSDPTNNVSCVLMAHPSMPECSGVCATLGDQVPWLWGGGASQQQV